MHIILYARLSVLYAQEGLFILYSEVLHKNEQTYYTPSMSIVCLIVILLV